MPIWALYGLPASIIDAARTLTKYGVNPEKLWGLLQTRRRGRPKKYPRKGPALGSGRPRKPRKVIDGVLSSVEDYKKDHPGATDKAGIADYLTGYAQWARRSEGQVLRKHLRPLQKELSRYRSELRRRSQ